MENSWAKIYIPILLANECFVCHHHGRHHNQSHHSSINYASSLHISFGICLFESRSPSVPPSVRPFVSIAIWRRWRKNEQLSFAEYLASLVCVHQEKSPMLWHHCVEVLCNCLYLLFVSNKHNFLPRRRHSHCVLFLCVYSGIMYAIFYAYGWFHVAGFKIDASFCLIQKQRLKQTHVHRRRWRRRPPHFLEEQKESIQFCTFDGFMFGLSLLLRWNRLKGDTKTTIFWWFRVVFDKIRAKHKYQTTSKKKKNCRKWTFKLVLFGKRLTTHGPCIRVFEDPHAFLAENGRNSL